MILQFEQRTSQEAFDNLIWISNDVNRALKQINDIHAISDSVASRRMSVSHFRGTRNNDTWTVQNFDSYKRDLLDCIKKAKSLLEEIES